MGRPSLAGRRRQEIVAATIRCLAEQGLAGTTLERIAETAGMSRGHVRHFAGNRDELLLEAARAFWLGGPDDAPAGTEPGGGAAEPAALIGATVESALDYLFGELAAPGAENRAAVAFVEAARSSPALRAVILQGYDELRDALDAVLAAAKPTAPVARRHRVASGVFSLAIGNTFLIDIDAEVQRSPEARAAALDLIGTLDA